MLAPEGDGASFPAPVGAYLATRNGSDVDLRPTHQKRDSKSTPRRREAGTAIGPGGGVTVGPRRNCRMVTITIDRGDGRMVTITIDRGDGRMITRTERPCDYD